VSSLSRTAVSVDKKCIAIHPPIIAPTATNKFHCCVFQSNLKKSEFLPAPHKVHRVLKLDDIPKLFPKNKRRKSMSAIIGPPTYQGQGLKIHSIVLIINLVYKVEGQT
jgi:hypothetical protein